MDNLDQTDSPHTHQYKDRLNPSFSGNNESVQYNSTYNDTNYDHISGSDEDDPSVQTTTPTTITTEIIATTITGIVVATTAIKQFDENSERYTTISTRYLVSNGIKLPFNNTYVFSAG